MGRKMPYQERMMSTNIRADCRMDGNCGERTGQDEGGSHSPKIVLRLASSVIHASESYAIE